MFRIHLLCLFLLALLTITPCLAQSESPSYELLKDLEVFTGEWEATTAFPAGTPPSEKLGELAGRKVNLNESVRWAPGKCAQIVEFSFEMEGAPPILGTMLIAWDQEHQEIRGYEFTSQKGTWTSAWKKEGDHWTSTYEGTDLDGDKHSGKRHYRFSDADHYVIQDTDRMEAGKALPDMEIHYARKTKSAVDEQRKQVLAQYEKDFLGRWTSEAKAEQPIPGFAEKGDQILTIIELKKIQNGLYVADSLSVSGNMIGPRGHFVFGWDDVGGQIQGQWMDSGGTSGNINYRFDGKNWSGDGSTVNPDGTEVKSEFRMSISPTEHVYHSFNITLDGESLPDGSQTFTRQ